MNFPFQPFQEFLCHLTTSLSKSFCYWNYLTFIDCSYLLLMYSELNNAPDNHKNKMFSCNLVYLWVYNLFYEILDSLMKPVTYSEKGKITSGISLIGIVFFLILNNAKSRGFEPNWCLNNLINDNFFQIIFFTRFLFLWIFIFIKVSDKTKWNIENSIEA